VEASHRIGAHRAARGCQGRVEPRHFAVAQRGHPKLTATKPDHAAVRCAVVVTPSVESLTAKCAQPTWSSQQGHLPHVGRRPLRHYGLLRHQEAGVLSDSDPMTSESPEVYMYVAVPCGSATSSGFVDPSSRSLRLSYGVLTVCTGNL